MVLFKRGTSLRATNLNFNDFISRVIHRFFSTAWHMRLLVAWNSVLSGQPLDTLLRFTDEHLARLFSVVKSAAGLLVDFHSGSRCLLKEENVLDRVDKLLLAVALGWLDSLRANRMSQLGEPPFRNFHRTFVRFFYIFIFLSKRLCRPVNFLRQRSLWLSNLLWFHFYF